MMMISKMPFCMMKNKNHCFYILLQFQKSKMKKKVKLVFVAKLVSLVRILKLFNVNYQNE
jgi:hypothetical protein